MWLPPVSESHEPQRLWVPPAPPAHPRATAFVSSIVLIAIVGSASAIAFLAPRSNVVFRLPHNIRVASSTGLAAIGVIAGLIGLIFLVSGNIRRLRLIYEFTAQATELAAALTEESGSQEGQERPLFVDRRLVIAQLGDYENALLRLGAYEHALQVSGLIAQLGGRLPYHFKRYYSLGNFS